MLYLLSMIATHQSPQTEHETRSTIIDHEQGVLPPERAPASEPTPDLDTPDLDVPGLLDLLDAYLDGSRSLLSIARAFNLSLTQLAAWLASPEIKAELDALQSLTEQRIAHIAASCRPDALLALHALLQAPNPHAPATQRQVHTQRGPDETDLETDPETDPDPDSAHADAHTQCQHARSHQAGDPKLIARHHEFRRRVATTLLRESHPPRPPRTSRPTRASQPPTP